MKIEGEALYVSKAGKRHRIEGYGSLPDSVELEKLDVDGSVSFGKIFCDKFKVDGECSGDSLTAEKVVAEGECRIDFIKAVKSLEIEGSMKIDSVESADVVIESRSGTIGEINCTDLRIFDSNDNFDAEFSFGDFSMKFSQQKSFKKNFSQVRIKKITAENVELENCKVSLIECINANIGSNCDIEKLIVSGKCKIASDSEVVEVVKNERSVGQ